MASPLPRRDFVKEVPELQRISGEPTIAAALERGDAHALYHALSAWRRQYPNLQEPWVDGLLQNRRFFMEPSQGAPRMVTVNGVGTSLYGSADFNPSDQTYVATLFFVFLFLPLVPLAQYLVRRGEGRGWHFFGKVPMTRLHRTWRTLAALAAVVALSGGAAGAALLAWQRAQSTKVQVLSGLSVPVRVQVDGHPLELPREGRAQVSLPPGPHIFLAELESGERLEEMHADIPRWSDVVAYNVLGSAPAYLDEVIYSSGPGEHQGSSTPLGGRTFYTQSTVQYVFQEPPAQIQLSSHSSSESRYAFDVAKGGWRTALRMLEQQSDWEQAARLAANVARADPDNPEARERALQLTHRFGGTLAVAVLAQQWVQHEPENTSAQRLYVDALRGTGQGTEALQFARERLSALPESLEFAELVARAEEPATALQRMSELVAAHPSVGRLRRVYADRLLNAWRVPEALTQFEKLQHSDGEQHARAAAGHARALFLLGKLKEACAVLESRLEAGRPQWEEAILYGQLWSRAPKGTLPHSANYLLEQLLDGGSDKAVLAATFAVESGAADAEAQVQALKAGISKESLAVQLAAKRDARDALGLVQKASERALAQVDDPTALLLALEAKRAGDAPTARRLERAMAEIRLDPAVAWAYVESGTHAERLSEWGLEFQAVLHFERARQLAQKDPNAAKPLFARAEALRPLTTTVAAALSRWPRGPTLASSSGPP